MVKKGVDWYTKMTAQITIAFPEDQISCANCKVFCRHEEAFKRYSCRLTGETLLHPFVVGVVGSKCPFEIVEEGTQNEAV